MTSEHSDGITNKLALLFTRSPLASTRMRSLDTTRSPVPYRVLPQHQGGGRAASRLDYKRSTDQEPHTISNPFSIHQYTNKPKSRSVQPPISLSHALPHPAAASPHALRTRPTTLHQSTHTTYTVETNTSNHITNNIVHEHDTNQRKANKHINLRGGEKGRLHGHAEHARVRVQRVDVDDHSPHRVLPPLAPRSSARPAAFMSSLTTASLCHPGPPVQTPAGTDSDGRGTGDRYSR